MPKREHLDEVIERVQYAITNKRSYYPTGTEPILVELRIADVERLINASIWGDD